MYSILQQIKESYYNQFNIELPYKNRVSLINSIIKYISENKSVNINVKITLNICYEISDWQVKKLDYSYKINNIIDDDIIFSITKNFMMGKADIIVKEHFQNNNIGIRNLN